MGSRRILALSGLALLMVFGLSVAWAFWLDDVVTFAFRAEGVRDTVAEGWGFVVTAVFLAGAALSVPVWVAIRADQQAWADQEALRESEERYRTLVELSPSAILVHKRGTIVYANSSASTLLAATDPEDLTGIGILCLVHPDDQDKAGIRLRELWEGRAHQPLTEMKFIRVDGEEVDVAVSSGSTTFRGEQAQQSVIRDITERRRTEALLRTVAEGVSGTVGETFFESLVEYLAEGLKADYAFVGELVPEDVPTIRTIAVRGHGRAMENFEYRLDGTPCAHVVGKQTCVFDNQVQEQFPQDRLLVQLGAESYVGTPLFGSTGSALGILVVLRSQPIEERDAGLSASLLQIFAVRAAAELERSHAEETVRASEERFRSLAQSASDAIVSADPAGRITFWNAGAEAMFGHTRDQMLGESLTLLMPERHRGAHTAGIRRVSEGGERHVIGGTVEVEGLRKDGSEFPIELSLSTWTARDGRYFTAIIRDISERREAEEQVRKLSSAVEQSPVTVMITNTSGIIEYVNPTFTETSGYTPKEALGQNPRFLKSGNKSDEDYRTLWETISGGEVWRGEFLNLRKDGELYWEMASISPIRAPDGTITHYIAVKEDITERKRYQQALEESRERLATAQRIALLGNWDRDLRRNSVLCSDEVYNIFGLDHEAFSGTWEAFLECIHPDDRPRVEEAASTALHDGEAYAIEHRIIRPDGQERVVSHQGEVRLDEAGEPARMIGTVRDITSRTEYEAALRRAKEEAEFASRTKTEFLANMSHELRTPLNSIIGFSDIIATEAFGTIGVPQYREYVKDINDSGKHLLDLINDLLDIARIETGELRLYEHNVDVSQVVKACHRLIKERAMTAGLELTVKVPEGLPPLYVDERQIKQILLNLLSNAVKFTESGGTVTLTVSQEEDGAVAFAVADTGIGIAEDDIETVLSTFGQADGSLARRYEGAGLGLPLSKRLAELHGGKLLLESEPGVGTTVKVCMPADRTVDPA